MRNVPLYFLLLCFLKTELSAQAPATDSIWLEAKNLRICLRADGSLYSGSPGGAVQYRHQTLLGEKWVNVVQDAGLWFGGIDPAGNLKLSVQSFEPRATDFLAGLPNLPESARFWQVSFDDVARHVLDYSEDAIINEPIEAIFAWPGRGNRFFREYNGFDLPAGFYANNNAFFDRNYNSIYEPDKGEYPISSRFKGYYGLYYPEQITAFFFHTDDFTLETAYSGFPVSGIGFAYTYDCQDDPVFKNSVFFSWTWQHTGPERSDSCQIGLFLNSDIGNPNDDYQGSRWNAYFAYNADSLYDARFGLQPPVLSLCTVHSPLDTFGYPAQLRVMPIGKPYADDPSNPPSISFPEKSNEYYNYLTGAWRDGQPLTKGGTGYNLGGEFAPSAFPGNPYKPGIWSEVNAKNKRGDRRAVLSWDYQTLLPGSLQQLIYFLTVHPAPGNSKTQFEKFNDIFFTLDNISTWMDGLPYVFGPAPNCPSLPGPIFSNFLIRCYPNPVSDVLNIQFEGGSPTLMRLYDVHQRIVGEIKPYLPFEFWSTGNPAQLSVRHLPSGVYYLEVGSRYSIHTSVQKIIVLH